MNRFVQQFLHHEAAGGVVMLTCAALALIVANSPLAADYQSFINAPLGHFTVSLAVNDILMPIFFLLVGMELKREMMEGFLSGPGQKTLPLIAALGGIAMPAVIYLIINDGIAANHAGWAIPTATDIAFAVCVLSLLGKRVPPAAKIFLLAIAIYDDLAAILIIAFVYSGGVDTTALLLSAGVCLGLYGFNKSGVKCIWPYMLLGAALWHYVHEAGIHTTVAGMLTGLFIPIAKKGHGPLERLVKLLHPWVAFGILPLFAFVSAGVSFTGITPASLLAPLPLGIALGLFLGKQLGIFAATYAAVRTGYAKLPRNTSWMQVYGVSIIAGIGFTMSLFIGFLAFSDTATESAIKIGVMVGSLASALLGLTVMRAATK